MGLESAATCGYTTHAEDVRAHKRPHLQISGNLMERVYGHCRHIGRNHCFAKLLHPFPVKHVVFEYISVFVFTQYCDVSHPLQEVGYQHGLYMSVAENMTCFQNISHTK